MPWRSSWGDLRPPQNDVDPPQAHGVLRTFGRLWSLSFSFCCRGLFVGTRKFKTCETTKVAYAHMDMRNQIRFASSNPMGAASPDKLCRSWAQYRRSQHDNDLDNCRGTCNNHAGPTLPGSGCPACRRVQTSKRAPLSTLLAVLFLNAFGQHSMNPDNTALVPQAGSNPKTCIQRAPCRPASPRAKNTSPKGYRIMPRVRSVQLVNSLLRQTCLKWRGLCRHPLL